MSAPSIVAPTPPTHGEWAGSSAYRIADPHGDCGGSGTLSSFVVPTTRSSLNSGAGAGGSLFAAAAPGSARALARMIHFSNRTAPTDDDRRYSGGDGVSASSTSASATVSSDGGSGGGAKAIGSWMVSQGGDGDFVPSVQKQGEGEEGLNVCVKQAQAAPDLVAAETRSSGSNKAACHVGVGVVESRTTNQNEVGEGEGGQSFVIESSDNMTEEQGKALSGLWRVFYSQGYPYYLHEASGHSQWEDPRGSQELLTPPVTDTLQESSSGQYSNADATAADREEEPVVREEMLGAKDTEQPLVSPIKPIGVSVAVNVSQYTEVAVPDVDASERDRTTTFGVSSLGHDTGIRVENKLEEPLDGDALPRAGRAGGNNRNSRNSHYSDSNSSASGCERPGSDGVGRETTGDKTRSNDWRRYNDVIVAKQVSDSIGTTSSGATSGSDIGDGEAREGKWCRHDPDGALPAVGKDDNNWVEHVPVSVNGSVRNDFRKGSMRHGGGDTAESKQEELWHDLDDVSDVGERGGERKAGSQDEAEG